MKNEKIINIFAADLQLQRRIHLTRLVDDREGLTLLLEEEVGEKRKIKFLFKDVYGYRNFDEGDLVEYWAALGGYPGYVCFQIAQSNFLDWAKLQSPYKEYPEGVMHFTVATSNDVIDILTYTKPELTILDVRLSELE